MKKIIFGIGAAAAVMAVACTKIDGPATPDVFYGDKAYIVMNINDVGAGRATRASEGQAKSDGGFQNGSTAENAVADAHFYFYDKSGVFVTEANVWNGGSAEEENGSVEFRSNTVVTLQGLTHTAYPNYVVTVLNKPADFTAPETLAEFAKVYADEESEGIMRGSKTWFTMSTSSYVGAGNDPYYFATPVTEKNFTEEPIEYEADGTTPKNCTPVTIYVERLASKVTVVTDPALAQTGIKLGDGTTGYPIVQTATNQTGTASTSLYVRLEGWKLNATARLSDMVKDIDSGSTPWTDGYLGFTWNDATNFRSYWGKSFNYGLGIVGTDYPASSGGQTDATEAVLSPYLKYTSLSGTLNDISAGSSEYCAENTNTAGDPSAGRVVITSRNSPAITSILVKATLCNAEGNGVEVIRHDGILYTPASYLTYALTHLSSVYWLDGEEYKRIDAEHVSLADAMDGKVILTLNSDYQDGTFYNASHEPMSTSSVQMLVDSFNTNFGEDANYYKEGAMYYSIPIAHLREHNAGDTGIYEGDYGVVRNHWYYVTVTSVENLGRGIYNPEEVIVPIPDDQTYFIGAQINVLAWRMVNNGVIL